MGFEVRLLSTGHTFEAEAQESVLEAALRSGINLSYHCNTGSCGECKARVVEGNVDIYRHSDYVIPEAEKLRNVFLLCSVAPRSDLIIEAQEAFSPEDIPHQQINVKVARIDRINDRNIVLHLRTPRSRTLRFLAGQWVQLTIDGLKPQRFYVASCPCNGMIIQLHLQKNNDVDQGEDPTVSKFYHYVDSELKIGQNILLEGPYGQFTLDEESRRPIVLIAQDSGFAPIKSLVEHSIALDLPQSMYLFWLAGSGREHYQSNYCRSWEDALDCFIYFPYQLAESRGANVNSYEDAINFVLGRTPVETEIDLYLSGPQLMSDSFSTAFSDKGTPQGRIHVAHTL